MKQQTIQGWDSSLDAGAETTREKEQEWKNWPFGVYHVNAGMNL